MPTQGQTFDALIQSLSAIGSASSNLADLSLTGDRAKVIPTIDYNQFGKHVFFGDAVRKYRHTLRRIQNTYPIGLCASDTASLSAKNVYKVDQWKKESSGFDIWFLDQLSLTDTMTALSTNQNGENVALTFVNRNSNNAITGSQTAIVDSISARAIDFEELNFDTITKTSGSANDHTSYPLTAELSITRTQKLKNMLPQVLFDGDENQVLEKLLQTLGDEMDVLKGFIDQLSYIKSINYSNINRTPNKFLPVLSNHFGVTLFQSAVNSAIDSFLISSTTGATTQEVAYEVWKRVLKDLIYIIKNKGTRETIESIGRLYGVDYNFMKTDEYSIFRDNIKVKVPEEIDVPILFSTGDVYVQVPTGSNSALDFSPNRNFTIQMRVSATAALEHSLLVHPLYSIKLDASGQAHFVATAGTTASTTQSSISSFIQKKDNFINVFVSRTGDNLKIWTMGVSGSGSGGDDVVVLASAVTTGVAALNYDSSGGSASFGAYFPGSGSFTGYMHEVRSWTVPLEEEDLKEHTRNWESTSFINSTGANAAGYGSLSGHWKLRENRVLTGGHNYIVDSTTAANTATPVNFNNQTTKRYRVFPNMSKFVYWYPTGLAIDNDKVRQSTDLEKQIEDPGYISITLQPINAVNRDIRNVLQDVNVRELLGDPKDLYENDYTGPITAAMNNIRTRYGNVVTDDLESGSGLSAAANRMVNLNTFVDAMDNFNDVLGNVFTFIDQFIPAKSNVIAEGLLIEPHILHRPKDARISYDASKITPTAFDMFNHYLELKATAATGATTATFQGFKYKDGIYNFIDNSITSNQLIKPLSNRAGESVNIPRFSQTRAGRFIPVKITPADPGTSQVEVTLSRLLLSPTADIAATTGVIDSTIRLLKNGKPFETEEPSLRFEFPSSADGTNYFKATIGNLDAGQGRIVDGKNTEFTSKLSTKELQMKLELAQVVRSASGNGVSGEIGVVGINITNLFSNQTQVVRIAIGSRQELFDELNSGQGGTPIGS